MTEVTSVISSQGDPIMSTFHAPRRRQRRYVVLGLLVASLAATGCGGTTSSGTPAAAPGTTAAAGATTAKATATTAAGTAPAAPTTTSAPTATTAAGATTAAAATGPATGAPIKLGVAVAQSGGGASLLGQDQVVGVKIAADYFNKQGGVNGRPIEIVLQDTLVDEAGAINAFNSLIADEKLVGIIGPTLSQQAFAADPIADKAGVPVIAPSNTAKGVPEIGDYIARVSAPVAKVAPGAIAAAKKVNPAIKKAVVAYAQNDAFSKSETGTFQDAVKANGIELSDPVLTFQTTDTDFTNQVNAVLDAKPELVVISGLVTDAGNFVRQLKETGYKGTVVVGNGMNTRRVFAVCQAQCDGVIIAQAYSNESKSTINTDYTKLYKDAKGELPLQVSAQAFTAVQVFIDALKALDKDAKLDTLSPKDLRTKLNAKILAGKYATVLGDISFEPSGEIVQSSFYVAQIKMSAPDKGDFTYVS
jgi:branched-chain amino acid transport system substrate-binding protein